MELSDCRFYCGGDGMRFLIYSDALCRIRYLESIRVPFGEGLVDVYEIEPGLECHWVVVRQGKKEAESYEYRWFLRQDSRFLERQCTEMPPVVQAQIPDLFPGESPQLDSQVA